MKWRYRLAACGGAVALLAMAAVHFRIFSSPLERQRISDSSARHIPSLPPSRSDTKLEKSVAVRSASSRDGAAPALPPPYAPLVQNFGDLLARSNRGEAAAATRLYRDLTRCTTAEAVIQVAARVAERVLSTTPERGLDEAQKDRLDRAQREMDVASRLQTLCTGVTDDMLGHLASVTLRAAQLGSSEARDCYVHRGPLANPKDLIDSPESLRLYRAEAPGLIEEALEDGDWKMVDMLAYAHWPGTKSLLAGLVGHDLGQYYQYLKLFRLGADAQSASRLDRQLDDAASSLDPERKAGADTWAQAMFERHFSGFSTEAAPPNWDACAISEE